MHKYYLLTATDTAPVVNPGCQLISYGIRQLIHDADPDALFFDESLFLYNATSWSALLSQADGIFICGNPRYDRSDYRYYWLTDLWVHIAAARARGILCGDLFGGSASPLSAMGPDDDAAELLKFERNILVLKAQAKLDAVVVRDPTSLILAKQYCPGAVLLPCSTFWAARYFRIKGGSKTYNAIAIPSLHGSADLLHALKTLIPLIPNNLPTYFVAHAINNWNVLNATLPDYPHKVFLFDPISLLDFYSRCSHLISCRLHASIPALSLGAQVINVAVDRRSDAFLMFGAPSMPYTSVLAGHSAPLVFHSIDAGSISSTRFIEYFNSTILSKLK